MAGGPMTTSTRAGGGEMSKPPPPAACVRAGTRSAGSPSAPGVAWAVAVGVARASVQWCPRPPSPPTTVAPWSSRRRGGGEGERAMVPEATFTSYYGRPVVKPSPWKADIPAYFFLGGVAAGSSTLGAGADLTGRPTLRRAARLGALAGISMSMGALIHDLGRP